MAAHRPPICRCTLGRGSLRQVSETIDAKQACVSDNAVRTGPLEKGCSMSANILANRSVTSMLVDAHDDGQAQGGDGDDMAEPACPGRAAGGTYDVSP